MHQPDMSQYVYQFSYLGIFLWFLVIEQLTPIPEEVSLVSVGYIAIHAGLSPFLAGIVSLAGLLLTDNILFYITSKGSRFTKKLFEKLNEQIAARVEKNLHEHATRTLFISALIPKFRFFSPIIAGGSGINWKKFFWINGAATLLYVTVYMLIGIIFHNSLEAILKELSAVQHSIFIAFMLIVAVFLTIKAKKLIFK